MPASEAVLTRSYTVGAILKEAPDFLGTGDLYLLYPYSMYEAVTGQAPAADAFWFRSGDHAASYESMGQILMELGNSRSELQDLAANGENQRAMVTVVNVFSYGFIIPHLPDLHDQCVQHHLYLHRLCAAGSSPCCGPWD